MKVVVQRVKEASVEVEGRTISSIGNGLLLLVGFTHDDTEEDIAHFTKKIVALRIFDDEAGVMNRSVQEVSGSIIAVSQFTLYANCKKGNRPSYIAAAPGNISEPLYERFCEQLEEAMPGRIQRGKFGADMKVKLLNDGPVTIILDSTQIK